MSSASFRERPMSSVLYMRRAKGARMRAEMIILPAAMARKSASDHRMRMAEKDTATTAMHMPR